MEMLLRMRDRRVNRAAVTVAAILGLVLFGSVIGAQNSPDETAIRQILDNEVATWNKGDTDGYSRHFAADGTFTNIVGCSSRDIRSFETVTKLFSKANSAEPR